MNKNLSKYIAAFDYVDKALTVFATSGGVSIIYFGSFIGVSAGIASARLMLDFFDNRNNKESFENNKI